MRTNSTLHRPKEVALCRVALRDTPAFKLYAKFFQRRRPCIAPWRSKGVAGTLLVKFGICEDLRPVLPETPPFPECLIEATSTIRSFWDNNPALLKIAK